MGYRMDQAGINRVFNGLAKEYRLFAPKCFEYEGAFSDTDSIHYGEVQTIEEIELMKKSNHSFKDALLPISETLFYFTEDEVKVADAPAKGALLFLRSCDLHALKRLDAIYLQNGEKDFYYKRLRDKIKIVLIGCEQAFESCFCVDMNTNRSENYDLSLDTIDGEYYLNCQFREWDMLLKENALEETIVMPKHVTETVTKVHVPDNLTAAVAASTMWDEYDARCIACGRCNFSCPTCTCYTMQDIFYTDNGKVGERRRVQASCMVDGFTDVAGGGSYRKKHGQRMRFKTLHKMLDFKQRFGYQMCVGCGRCDDVCPEYISFSNIVNRLDSATQEVSKNE
ncbi:anaerobic sulfite reductase subunit A [Lachnospiraceae bacterium PF1-21]|uniref:Anaerobic sulfite reductase subunit AsrA n=1 Tax=Ohessyouella blattaphilus TaxID=2949333 RepID=A0ABT1EEV9_9FIRM|nr:anaerobic sulfite reductase subunit AsrA [Ohessyouella blattaphilus]MCP1109230.1 anaerobic sulfite reductase subunit AsrA [Ohessyouella blattaphilus]MCR8562624.1 anaerobic sulfite reductase subunit AsrA [Ohessyouella blattaphilus]